MRYILAGNSSAPDKRQITFPVTFPEPIPPVQIPDSAKTLHRQYCALPSACWHGAAAGAAFPDQKKADEELLQIFNRDFTTGYYFKNQGADLMSYRRPKTSYCLNGPAASVRSPHHWDDSLLFPPGNRSLHIADVPGGDSGQRRGSAGRC